MMHQDLDASSARYIAPGDPEWPSQLDALNEADKPAGLWVMGAGRLNELAGKAVAVSGARASTAYGDVAAAEFADELSTAGYTVVNGGAYGTDTAALRGAVSAKSAAIVVSACGLDSVMPNQNKALFQNVLACGGLIISEYAIGEHPTMVTFFRRGRIIAALSQGVVIVEAAVRSQARNLVDWAGEINRNVMAVPGPVTSATSQLPHQLIRDGRAALVTSGNDVARLLG